MEFKVWVDGMQRVVCGVTPDTTCQDIVIALAHATGRTGRFSLIEKWRKTDRPIPPNEMPLRLLQKWGEYSNDVQFVLIQNEIKCDVKTNNNSNQQSGDGTVKRSLTFTGVHNAPRAIRRIETVDPIREQSLSEDSFERMPSPIFPDAHHRVKDTRYQNSNNNNSGRLPLSKSYDSLERPRTRKISPRRVSAQRKLSNNRIGDAVDTVYGARRVGDVEEYSSQQWERGQARGNHGDGYEWSMQGGGNKVWPAMNADNQQSHYKSVGNGHIPNTPSRSKHKPADEYTGMVRLVMSQRDRLQTQLNDMLALESELSSAEESRRESENQLKLMDAQIAQLEKFRLDNEAEISGIDSEKLTSEIAKEQIYKEELKSQVQAEKKHLELCEKNLDDAKIKVAFFSERLELERTKREKHMDIPQVRENGGKSDLVLTDLHNEVSLLELALQHRQKELGDLERDLKEANMQEFAVNAPKTEKTVDESGVFKQLSRPASTNPMRRGEDNSTTVITPPDGVWV